MHGATACEQPESSWLGRYPCLSIGCREFRCKMFLKRKSGKWLGWVAIGAKSFPGATSGLRSAPAVCELHGGRVRHPLSIAEASRKDGLEWINDRPRLA
ncbi:hypothetical protein HBH56_118990 [Parastagonospora nodorum]|uniref:Uncharacterized protein n=1 Tax=Phaeosphaeria nodorum (strain SN15 / ATCC MYA-4574 / FGSC 10173) TaxID=321614 RepID=A0A7U2I8R7_PHANO|nr:hypothetical protein HBH56_118990 [Parastagonospora nodorum]QRD05337.1 hypothetical protein JI435_422320 [Parastagonospora nodorum SN15]KAH3928700.1 hypothetical protein HBH54_130210 [Parastagonospora nodorum]KAH3959904.1 hypothetical protein HBH51_197380 [Parastagonospora nodorum]KAH3998476.1 hypothetical protein HBI10_128280 [Parastagonospora nodorum]